MRKPWATGPSDYGDDFFRMDNCRGPPRPMAEIPIICAAQKRRRRALAARAIRRLQFQQWRPGEPATRRGKERRAVDRGERQGEGAIAARCCCRWSPPTRPIPRRWQWEHYKAWDRPRGDRLPQRAGGGTIRARPRSRSRCGARRCASCRPTRAFLSAPMRRWRKCSARRQRSRRARRDADL